MATKHETKKRKSESVKEQETEQKSRFKRAVLWVKRAAGVLTANKYTTISGALAFFLVMSFVPFFFWLTTLFARSGIRPEAVLELELFGWAKEFLLLIIQNAEKTYAAGAGILFVVTTLFSSTSFFYHLRRSGEILYNYRRRKKGWKVRLSAIFLTLAVLLFFFLAGAAFIGAGIYLKFLPRPVFYLVIYSMIFAVGFFAAWILNSYICPYRCRPRDILLGSLLTALAWMAASGIFALYFELGNKEKLYGALTFVIVFFIWLYWMMICFTAGAVFNRHRMELRGLEHKTL